MMQPKRQKCLFVVLGVAVRKHKTPLLLSALLLLSGCQALSSGQKTTATAENVKMNSAASSSLARKAVVNQIHAIKFTLPPQYEWSAERGKGKNVTVFSLNNRTRSPVKIIYQTLPNSEPSALLATHILAPLRKSCQQSALSVFTTKSAYPHQLNHEVLCRHITGSAFGMVSYLTLFSDKNHHHVLIAEIVTPKSDKIGHFSSPKTPEEQRVRQAVLAYIQAIQIMMIETKVCNAKGACV